MSATPSLLRRVATALAAHAARMLPASRSQWAEAMTHEVEHIGADLEAVTWAAGCVLASYVERSKVMNILRTTPARLHLALVIGTQVLAFLFATALTLATGSATCVSRRSSAPLRPAMTIAGSFR
ncbi:MAG TPA: hypothetical protein VFL36_12995 [Myxococcales bacterium]|nr:hypothetical protein [Myxococcales bacterium]